MFKKKDKEKEKGKGEKKDGVVAKKKPSAPAVSAPVPPSDPRPTISAQPASAKWGKGTSRPDDAILAVLKAQCEKDMEGGEERKFIQLTGPPPEPPPPVAAIANDTAMRRMSTRGNMSGSGSQGPPAGAPPIQVDDAKDEADLLFTDERVQGRPVIKGGSREKLIERLTYEKYPDPDYLKAFMLTYRSFITPIDLLKELATKRWFLAVPEGQDPEDFDGKVQRPVRLRVFNVFKHWIQHAFYDFEEDSALEKELLDFIESTMKSTGMENPANQLLKMYNRQKETIGSGREQRKEIMWGTRKPPVPHLPMNLNSAKLQLLDLHAEELARQLTLIEYELYRKIKPKECLNQKWVKGDKDANAPNILGMIKRFNQVSTWVAYEVVRGESVKERTATLKHVIDVAEYCKSLNNFNAMMEIISGLNSSAVFRLKLTWDALPSKYQKSFQEMATIMSREQNFKNFRAYLHNVDPPCIPYLGVYLTDLTFIEDGNPDNLPDGNVNFVKRQKVSHVISEIQQYQDTPYCLEEVVFIKDWLMKAKGIDEDELYKLSKLREGTNKPAEGGSGTPALPSVGPPVDDWGPLESIEGYPFDQPDTEAAIVMVKDGDHVNNIKGGTLAKLVERVAHDKFYDTNYLMAFLMTYKTFATANDILDLLEKRFKLPKPKKANETQMKLFHAKRVMPIHLRVFNVLKFWVDKFAQDFYEDQPLSERMKNLVQECVAANDKLEKLGSQILKVLEKASTTPIINPTHQCLGDGDGSANNIKVIDFDADQIAIQIMIINQMIFRTIRPRELMCQDFDGPDAEKQAPNICVMRRQFERIKQWTCSELAKSSDATERYLSLAHFIRIAAASEANRDFHTMAAVISGIIHLSKELTSTFSSLPEKTYQQYDAMMQLVKRPKKLREREKGDDTTSSAIPYVDLALRQVTGLKDMLPDFLQGDLINFEKRRKIYDVFSQWQQFQNQLMQVDSVPQLQSYLLNVPLNDYENIKNLCKAWTNLSNPTRVSLDLLSYPPKLKAQAFDMRKDRSFSIGGNDDSENVSEESSSPRRLPESHSSATIPGTLSTADHSSLRDALNAIILDDSSLVEGLINDVRKELQNSLLAEMKEFASASHDEMIVLHGQFGMADLDQVQSAARSIVTRKFPQATSNVSQWRVTDTEGSVYGWQEEISLFVVQGANGNTLVDVAAHVDAPELGAVLRMVELYESETQDSQIAVAIITPSITSKAAEIAAQRDITIIEF